MVTIVCSSFYSQFDYLLFTTRNSARLTDQRGSYAFSCSPLSIQCNSPLVIRYIFSTKSTHFVQNSPNLDPKWIFVSGEGTENSPCPDPHPTPSRHLRRLDPRASNSKTFGVHDLRGRSCDAAFHAWRSRFSSRRRSVFDSASK